MALGGGCLIFSPGKFLGSRGFPRKLERLYKDIYIIIGKTYKGPYIFRVYSLDFSRIFSRN